ncbi:MAG: hypothetical protein NT039_00200 [Candidatus Berkelbacteria bacterium]|nr:hypothetical protein [Candidatus Berkelbacteria bacterium]
MNEEFLSIKDESSFNPPKKPEPVKHEDQKPSNDSPKEGLSAESKLLIVTLVLFFIALNVWGYYFYRKGIFGINADISNTPTPTPKNFEKSDSIYMLPGV